MERTQSQRDWLQCEISKQDIGSIQNNRSNHYSKRKFIVPSGNSGISVWPGVNISISIIISISVSISVRVTVSVSVSVSVNVSVCVINSINISIGFGISISIIMLLNNNKKKHLRKSDKRL